MSSRPPLPPLPPQHQHQPLQQQQQQLRPPLPIPSGMIAQAGPPPPPLPPIPSGAPPPVRGVYQPLPAPQPQVPGHPFAYGSPIVNDTTGNLPPVAFGSPSPHRLSLTPPRPGSTFAPGRRPSAESSSHLSESSASSASNAVIATLSLPLPGLASLGTSREKALALGDPNRLVNWAADVVKYVERKSTLTANSGTATEADLTIKDAQLVGWIDEAITLINTHASAKPKPIPRALYLRGDLLASGSFPSYHERDLRSAFNDFEMAARMGYAPAFFRCARDYEVLGDANRARDVYEKGMSKGDICCSYRMGMAHLLGQLGLPQNMPRALQLLKDAAERADLETPQPAYIYGIILAGEFTQVSVAPNLLMPGLVSASERSALDPTQVATFEGEAFRHIARAAYLHFGPAQLKCGWAYEHAQLGCAFDPLLSVQYYILASQAGELEADLSLSKWFLCGAEGFFPKKEDLAFVFADKAARKGLASAEFALGYYFEVGVGTEKNLDSAKKWYRKAASHGSTDAKERLDELAKPQPRQVSRQEHQAHVDAKLIRKRTQAQTRSDKLGRSPTGGPPPAPPGPQQQPATQGQAAARPAGQNQSNPVEISRRRTMRMVDDYTAKGRPGQGMPAPFAESALDSNSGAHPQSRRQARQEASAPAYPSNTSTPSGAAPRPGGIPASQSVGQHGHGYSLSESYHPSANVVPHSTSANSGLSTSPGRKLMKPPGALGGPGTTAAFGPGATVPVHASSAPRPQNGNGHGPSPGYPSPQVGGHPVPPGVAAGSPARHPVQGQGAAAAGAAPVYNTFEEMGFSSRPSNADKDCIIM
ncbi:hypothetical protein OC846_001842 [Tilletia horrida]|uniref:Chitin synthase regulator 3 n=1 Tax=Tilletia horrida TaxID=155126 RepID=A0AAN6JTF9_9BASI|nr:hypothetical protein OC846_001842 [Tilletia horrida]